jgi:hypothetical protein
MTFLNDQVLDAALQNIISDADTATYCDGSPGDYTAATEFKSNGGNKLAANSVQADDFSKEPGVQSGRRLAFRFRQFTPQEAGTVDHIALVDDTSSTLIAVLETQSDVVIAADEVGFAFNQDSVDLLEIRDPS